MSKNFNIRRTHLFHNYYARLKAIALTCFEWENLPETCNAKFLEDTLFHYGRAIFVKDFELGYLNLKVNPSDTLNVYNEPLSYRAFSINYDKVFNRADCVYIRNNLIEHSTDHTIILYAERLALLDSSMMVNINAQKTPILIKCDHKTKLTMEKLYEAYAGDKPVIYGSKSLENPFEVLRTEAPFVCDKMREEKRALWNECLEFLGLNTNPSDKKKERLIVSEVNANNEQIDIQAETMLFARQLACEEINKKFGLNVSVKRKLRESEAVLDGKIHNRTEGDT